MERVGGNGPLAGIDSRTVLYGVFGDPVRHSKSPIMLNRAFREAGVNGVYAAFHVKPEELGDAVRGIRALGYRGVNVTLPHKVEVMKHIDEIDEGARLIGAVNTIVNENGVLTGYNTDGIGYVRSLIEETGITLAGRNILVVGAGGAARGIVYALAKHNPRSIWIANRTKERAVELADDFKSYGDIAGIGFDGISAIGRSVDLVVNTTLVGMAPNIGESPIETDWLTPEVMVSDIIYTPLKTELLKRAEAIGCRVHGGLGMFIYQGAYAFEYWTGLPAPVAAMRETVLHSMQP